MNLKTTNRILSFILALIMVLGFLPANALSVFADGDEGPVRAGNEGYPDGYDPDSQASVYAYNRWGSGGDPRISASIVASDENPSNPLAGDTLNYVLKYTYFEIPEINFGYPKAMPIYDYYKNNSLTLVLPAGLLLKGQESPKGVVSSPDDHDPTVPHTYTFPLADVDSNDPQQFSISVYVCNNGTDKSVATYDPMSLTFHTEFDVIDYTGGNETKVGHYTQEVSAASNPIVTSTPDRWGVEKSIKDGYPKFTDNNTKAVFSWEVKVGLLDNDGNLITDVSLYNRPGRDAVESIWLKDTFSTLLSKDGSSPYGTITITKGSNSRQWYTTGTEIEIELKDGLALDVSADADKVSINGTSEPDYLIRVPTLTTYTVTAEYNVTPEMIAEFYENPYELNSKNKAEVTRYKLAGVPEANGNETPYYPENLPLPVTEPASIKIGKLLREFAAGNMLNPYDDRYEEIVFKITLNEGGGTFTVYEKRESPAPYYVPIEGMTNVTSATLKKGVTYYLAPGHSYKIEEVLSTEQLGFMVPELLIENRGKDNESSKTISQYDAATYPYLTEGKEYTVDFVNKEIRGKIIVVKKDDGDNPVKNVVFALKDASGNYIYDTNGEKITAKTGDDGKATFRNVPLGTYQVVEESAPEGYVMDPNPQTVTVAENSTEQEVTKTFVNRRNGATLTLTKWVAISEATFKTKANASFTGTFKLYRRLQGTTSWGDPIAVNGETELTVGANGTISAVLPPFNDAGTPYEYKFVESIPEGFYDPATGSTSTAETVPVTLTKVENGVVVAADKSVDMYNRKLVKAHIQKKFYSVGEDGKLVFDASKTTTATLYKYIGSDTSTLEAITDYTGFTIGGGTNGQPVWVDFSNLKLYEGNDRIHYLIREVALNGYKLDTNSLTGALVNIGGVDYIELAISAEMSKTSSMTNAVPADQPAAEAVLNNIQQLVPVKVLKYDFYTGTYVSGSKFTVYNANGSVAADQKNDGRALNGIAVPADGDVFFLVPGKVYTFDESSVPGGYYLYSYTDANGTTVETTVDGAKRGTIDLTGDDYVLSFADVGVDKTVERRIYNYQDPLIRIMKKDTHNATVSGAKFTVYKAVTDDNGNVYYEAVTAENAIDSNADSDVRLPAGEYFIAETTVPEGYLDPNENFDKYFAIDSNYVQGHVGSATGEEMTFRKVTVTNGKANLLNGSGTDNICAFEFKNIKNAGSLKVLKKVYSALAKGFKIVIKNAAGEVVAEKVTGSNGAAVFENLDVYDENGDLIVYTVTEELTGTQSNEYYQASADQTVTLTPDTQTTKDTSGNALVVVNHTKVNVSVNKVFRRTWDYAFTQMEYLMENAEIGLFVKEGDEWKLVESKKTDENGKASFTGLRRDMEYALVELKSGDSTMFPNKGGEWRKYPSDDEYTDTIPADKIDSYNVSYLTSATMSADTTKKDFTVDELVNANHWVQFDITKWLDADTYDPSNGEAPIFDTEVNHDVDGDGKKDTKYDNAVFELYRFIMPGNTGSVTFDPANWETSGWELLGSYTSGTKYGWDGKRQIGEFMTNVDQGIDDHYVYLLVETDAGPNGGVINPNFKYTFWQEINKLATPAYNVTIAGNQYEARMMGYNIDTINNDDILNAQPIGPGTGVIYIASIRIAKWQDEFDWTTGEWKKNYTPLPNTTFVVRLNDANGKIIATMTTGLDAAIPAPSGQDAVDKAWAQSGTYLLGITNNADGTVTYTLKDYETGKILDADDGLVVIPFETTKDGVTYTGYKVPVQLVETSCPEGYSYDEKGYEMYLCFVNLIGNVNGTSWVFNDAFFVTEAGNKGIDPDTNPEGTPYTLATDGTEPAWYVTEAENYTNIPEGFFLGDDESQRRIVDYPIHNTFVTVHKYGYEPNATTTANGGMTSAQLDDQQKEAIKREALPGVTMYLQHKKSNGTWEFWNYKANTPATTAADAKFVTVEAGAFIFPDGLVPGTYRIYETSLPDDVLSTIHNTTLTGNTKALIKNVYEMAYYDNTTDHTSANSHPHARIFTVDEATKHVTMYNPRKVDLTLIKQDLNGDPLYGASFSLKSGSSTTTISTNVNGKLTFTYLASRNYVLVESKLGYSSAYLQQYLTTLDPALANLADPTTGAFIGYTYATSGDATERDTVISAITPSSLTPEGSADLSLTIKNPEQGKIEITKVDERNNAITTGTASFNAYFLPFTLDADGGFKFKNVFTKSPSTVAELTAAGFARFPDASTTLKTDTNGVLNVARKSKNFTNDDLTYLDPGIYAFIETAAPAGYDRLKTTDGKEVIYFVIVTGGLTVTVTGLAESVETWAGTVTTLINGTVADGVEKAVFSAKNYQKVTLKAMKELVYPDGATAESWTIFKPWEVRLDLYSSDKKTVLGSASFTSVSTTAVTFKKNGADVMLSQGETYYVKEAVVAPASAFGLVKLLSDGAEVTGTDGFYPVTVTKDGIVVTAQNKFMWGQVKFKKYDGDDVERNDFSNPLEGAEFEVRYDKNAGIAGAEEDWVKVEGSSVTYDDATKTYIADIPLLSEAPATYRIYETKAPEDHLLNTNLYLEVEVPQLIDGKLTNVIDYSDSHDIDEILINTEGNKLIITKYDNIHGSTYTVGQGEASFTIYHRTSTGEWEVVLPQTATDGTGKVTYLTTPGEIYAVAETAWAAKFLGLDGIYRITGEGENAVETLLTDVVTIDGKDYFVIVSSREPETIVLKAYNKPLIKPVIVKQDAGQYPKNIVPLAFFSIYKISDDFVINDANVEALIGAVNEDGTPVNLPVYEGYTNAANTYTGGGTYGIWDAAANGGEYWDPTCRYIIVETKVASGSAGKNYNTLNKDDNRVVWYVEVPVTLDVEELDSAKPPVFILKNVYGAAEADLVKDVVNNTSEGITNTVQAADTDNAVVGKKVESLLTGSRKVIYTIKPTVKSNNQALESFSVTDSGITFTKKKADYTGGPQPTYSIDSVVIGKAGQDYSNLDFTIPENTVVSAKVTFTFADGTTEIKTVNDLSEAREVKPTAGRGKVQSFVINYYSEGIDNATAGKYALSYGFYAEEITVNVTIDKLPDGNANEPVNEVTSFTNHASLDMVYPQWKEDGSGMVDPAPSVHIDKNVKVDVNPLRMPKISVSKVATDGTSTIQTIILGGTVVYKIGISNTGNEDFVDPVILDILPTGVVFDPYYNNGIGVRYDSNTHGHNEQYEIEIETRSGKITQYYEENGNQYGDAETAVIFKLKSPDPNKKCVIEAGSTIYLYFQANIKESAGMYKGDKIENDVYASTAKKAYHTTDNPNAYGFTDAGGNIPGTLDQAAKELDENAGGTGTVAQTREGGMHEDLASYAYNESDNKPIEYVWVPAKAEVTYNYASKITLKKAVRGDRDSGYEESKYFLAMSTRTNVPPREDGTSPLDYTVFHDEVNYNYGTVGWTRWRLTVDNGSTRALDRLIIGDILAKPNDGRLSSWESVWCGMLGVKNGDTTITEGTGANTYTMFYYVGTMEDVIDVEDAQTFQIIRKGALSTALEATTYWNNDNHNINRPADPNWKTLDEITDYTTIKAFIIVFDKDVKLQPSSDIVASYQTTVANMTDGTQFNNDFAFKNDNNIFRMNYRDSDKPLTSNQVSVTLMDKPVSVEGDLWIDEDWDGVQNKGNADAEGTLDWTTNGNRRDYSKYAIIRELIEATKYTITDLREGQGTSETDLGLDEYIGYGESIEHFRFEELIPGAIAYGVVSEEELYDADGNLLKDKLRTFEPARYLLNAEIRNADLMNIFKLTNKGTNYYRSDNPDIFNLTESIDNYVLDDNFYQAGTSNNVFVTKPFFIRYSTNIDKTKDIGLQTFRDVIIVKQALDNGEVKISGAKFEIYGPYGDSAIGERLATETPASGSPLHFSYQNGIYALVELVDGSWIRVKDDAVVNASTVVTELVTDANGKITVSGLNWWKEYDVKEIEAPQGYDRFGAVATADETVGTQIEDLENGLFTLMVPSEDKTSEMGPDQVTVENPRPVKTTPKVTKRMSENSEPLKHDTTFTFVLTAVEVIDGGSYWMDASSDPAVKTFITDGTANGTTASTWTKTITVKKGETLGTVLFDDLYFIKNGTYKFTITETAGTDTHIIYDGSTWEYTVVVSNNEALELVATESYAKQGDAAAEPEAADSAVFINEYIPEPTKWQAQVQKVMSEGEPTVKDKTFVFRMTAVSVTKNGSFWMNETVKTIIANNDFWTVEITVPAGSTGGTYPDVAALFDEITFTKAGTYVFKIEEVKPATALAGITYADDYVTVTITVTDPEDENSGVLVKTVDAVITKVDTADVAVEKADDDLITTTFKFTNKYTVEPVKVIPQVDKTLTMNIGPTFEDLEFTFELTPATGTGFTIAKHTVNGEELDGNITKLIIPAGSTALVTADFGEITFTKAGTYVFKIKELKNAPAPDGVTFDETEWTLTIVVTDNDGVLTETHTYSHGEGESAVTASVAKFVNNYEYHADGKIGLEGKKVLNGRTLKEGEFEFELYDEAGNLLQTVKNDANGRFVFKDLEYVLADVGTHKYKVVEKLGTLGGVTYSEVEYTVIVTVTNNGDGTLKVVRSDDIKDIVFENDYEAKGKIGLEGKKILNGRTLKEGEFEFELYDEDGNLLQTVKNDVNGKIVFADLEYIHNIKTDDVGTHKYTVVEKLGNLGGVTYSEVKYTVIITVTDNGDGTLKVVRSDDIKDIEFVNEYEAKGKIGLEGKKILNGRTLKEGEFEFELYDEAGNLLQTVKNDVNGKIVFTELEYILNSTISDVGTHKYTVVEKLGNLGGVTYSEVKYTVIITVTDNGDGTLKVVRSDDIKDIEFVNEYEAKGKIGLEGKKILNGRTLKEGEFEFELYDEDGNLLQTVKNDVNGKIVFTDLEYILNSTISDVGTHKYTVVEKLGTLGGVTYSEVKYTVIITVTDNEDGTLKVVRSDDIKDIEFVNEYEAKGKIGLEGKKILNGRILKEGEFEFELYDEDGNLLQTVKNDVNGKIVFTDLEYIRNGKIDEVGTHKYTVVEKLGNLGGVTYSEVKYTAIITVTDNEDGTLKVVRSDDIKDIEFVNEYEAKGKIGLEGRKVLNGRKLKEGEFEFELYDEAGNLLETVKNDADGKIVFTDLEYILNSTISDVGTHKYTVVEKLGNLGGVTYSTVKYTIEITVTDNEDGTLKVVRSDDIKDIVFENDYEAKGKIGLEGKKILDGRKLKEGEFEFELYDETGKLLETVKNDANGKIVFTDLEYIRNSTTDDVGTHKYTVVEKLGNLGGVTYSEVKYTVIITVTDNEDGTLNVVRSDGIKDIEFVNTYDAEGKIGIEGRKVLNGRKLKEGEFEFDLYDEDGNLLQTVKNDENGKIVFADLEYVLEDVGFYKYTVVEKLGNLGGVTYSDVAYSVFVKVADNGDGTLKVVRFDDIADIVFENDYEAKGKIGLEAKKILNGRTLKEGEFEFELYDEDGNLLETVKNDADGKIVFTDLEYIRNKTVDEVGTHKYTVVEKLGNLGGVTYSEVKYTVIITVTDNEDGTLKVVRSDDIKDIEFVNEYEAKGKIGLEGKKILNGRTLKEGEFEFELYDEAGNLLETVKNDVNGKIVFTDLEYIRNGKIDEVGTHKYTVVEKLGNLGGVTYSEVRYTVIITVTDNEDGTLKVVRSDDIKDIEFVNEYEAKGKIGLEAKKILNGRTLKEGEFEFELYDENGNLLETVKNDVNGKIVFTDLEYIRNGKIDEVGTHKYTVVEKLGNLGGVTYSEVKYTVIITVTDNEDGTLKVVRSDDIKDIEFVNEYEAKGKIGLEGKKILNGRTLKEGEFEFELYDEAGNLLETVKNDVNGKIVFTDLEYIRNGKIDEVGTHKYTVVEKLGNLGGVTYSEVEYTVIITVTDNEDGTLKVVRSDDIKDIEFVNEYEAKGKIGLEGKKILNGRTLKEGEFEFELYDEDGNLLQTVKNDVNGKIVFTDLEYIRNGKIDEVGTHKYTVVEKLGNLGGVTYSEVEYTVIITVTDNEDGTLKVVRSDDIKDIEFVNEYEAKGKIGLEGKKILNGRTLKEGEFEFELYDEDGNLLQTVKNDADGKIVFTDLEYILNSTISDVGTHKYTVVEKLGNLGGVTYSEVEYTVIITVTDNGDGTLTVVRSDDIKDIEFVNEYEAKGKIGLEGKKILNGRTLKEGEFEFELYDEAGNLLETVKNDADGKIVFTDLEYILNSTISDVGTHKYTIVEKLGNLGGVTYSEVEYTVIITVTDNEDGTLNVVRSDEIEDLEFVNTYDATGEIGLEARKVLNGRELKGGEFTFELYDESGKLIQSVVNNADGTVVFENLKYTLAEVGQYKFKLIEKAGDLFAVTYDETEYEIIVTVTDNGDGTLNVVRDDEIEDLVFNNSYDVTEAGVKKIWKDNDNQDGIRPKDLVVALMNGDVKVTEVTLNEENGWTYTVTNLPKYEKGVEIDYTWVEIDIPEGYTLESMTKEGVITSIINPHEPEKINISGGKLWTGETNPELSRPVSITVKLYADGVEIRSIEVTSLNDWTFTFEDLDKYKDGKEIVYTLGEIPVPGYVTKISDDEYIIVNDYIKPEPPQTGDYDVLAFAGIVMIALTGLFVLRKKKKVNEEAMAE